MCGSLLAAAVPAWAIEEPAFKVVAKTANVELRAYDSFLVAETRVNASFIEAGNLAFRPLFNYISGENRRQEKIEMTAPVSQAASESKGEKIDMTAPVTQTPSGADGSYVIGFVMPQRYTLATIPQPLSDRVTIREIAPRTMAVLKFSGTWGQERYAKHEKVLLDEVAEAGWRVRGKVEFARYDPPLMPWFLRRNEVMVEVEPKASTPAAAPATNPDARRTPG